MEPVPSPFPAPPLFSAAALPGACQAGPLQKFSGLPTPTRFGAHLSVLYVVKKDGKEVLIVLW